MSEEHTSPFPFHGGDLDWAERRFGQPRDAWIDLSTGINPWPYPLPAIAPETWTRLPQTVALDRLLRLAAETYGAPRPETVVAAPGTQALIRLLPRLWSPRRISVVAPTYGEHAASWRDAGHDVVPARDPADAANRADIVVLTNPNNPDGRQFAPDLLTRIADRLADRGGMLIVDEAFADSAPELSLVATADRPGRLVLRSFGKFYGLAGLRLGFAIGAPAFIDRVRRAIGPWPVGGPALAVGAQALADRGWTDATRTRLAAAASALAELLRAAGFEIIGGTALFVLAAHARADDKFERLGRAGILARHFPDHPGWLRFGLPDGPDAEARLRDALRAG